MATVLEPGVKTAATANAEKKPRLFAFSPSGDEMFCYCGGPGVDDALRGLVNVLRPDIEEAFGNEIESPLDDVQLEVRWITDQEVANLPSG